MQFKYCLVDWRLLSKTSLNLDKIALALFRFITTSLTCSFQVKLLSIRVLKQLNESNILFPFSLVFKSLSSFFFGKAKRKSSVLSTLREILFAFNEFAKFLRLWLNRLLRDFTELLTLNRLVSSTKWSPSKKFYW